MAGFRSRSVPDESAAIAGRAAVRRRRAQRTHPACTSPSPPHDDRDDSCRRMLADHRISDSNSREGYRRRGKTLGMADCPGRNERLWRSPLLDAPPLQGVGHCYHRPSHRYISAASARLRSRQASRRCGQGCYANAIDPPFAGAFSSMWAIGLSAKVPSPF